MKNICLVKMTPRITIIFLAIAAVALVACASGTPTQEVPGTKALTPCTDPRPQVCTMNYLPVCGQTAGGEAKTYSNGCGACSDPNVIGYSKGACE